MTDVNRKLPLDTFEQQFLNAREITVRWNGYEILQRIQVSVSGLGTWGGAG